jgi:simple sugar transport system substrate-binding protein
MKKVIVFLMIALVAIALSACTTPPDQGEPAASPPPAADTPAPADAPAAGGLIKVGFAQCKADESDWRIANTKSMQEALSAANGFDLILADSNNDAAKQVADVQGFIDQEVDYIVIAAVNVDGWDGVLQNAKSAGIPVILVDRTINASEDL